MATNFFTRSPFNQISVLLIAVSTLLTGCNSGTAKVIGIDEAEADISYINATDEMTSFYLKKDKLFDNDDEDKLFRDEYIVVRDIQAGQASSRKEYEFPFIENGVHLGVQDSISEVKNRKISEHLSDNNDLWAIAWQNGNEFELSLIKRKRSNVDGQYRIRIFSSVNLPVYLNGSSNMATMAEKNKVTSHLSVNNCADSLTIGEQHIDLCHVDLGSSYLIIIDQDKLRLMVKE